MYYMFADNTSYASLPETWGLNSTGTALCDDYSYFTKDEKDMLSRYSQLDKNTKIKDTKKNILFFLELGRIQAKVALSWIAQEIQEKQTDGKYRNKKRNNCMHIVLYKNGALKGYFGVPVGKNQKRVQVWESVDIYQLTLVNSISLNEYFMRSFMEAIALALYADVNFTFTSSFEYAEIRVYFAEKTNGIATGDYELYDGKHFKHVNFSAFSQEAITDNEEKAYTFLCNYPNPSDRRIDMTALRSYAVSYMVKKIMAEIWNILQQDEEARNIPMKILVCLLKHDSDMDDDIAEATSETLEELGIDEETLSEYEEAAACQSRAYVTMNYKLHKDIFEQVKESITRVKTENGVVTGIETKNALEPDVEFDPNVLDWDGIDDEIIATLSRALQTEPDNALGRFLIFPVL